MPSTHLGSDPLRDFMCTASCQIAPYCGDGRIQTQFGEKRDGSAVCSAACQFFIER